MQDVPDQYAEELRLRGPPEQHLRFPDVHHRTPASEWAHASHLLVALWYFSHHSSCEATRLVRVGLRRYGSLGGRISRDHETITLAWVAVITRFLAQADRRRPVSELAAMLLESCGDEEHLLRYDSQEVLMSDEARQAWVPPDRRPIE